MGDALNYILVAVLGYIVMFGLKDREDPTIIINFPKDGYEFRSNRQISVSANDNKGVKSIVYIIDDKVYHTEDSSNPFSDIWNPCNLSPGTHTLKVQVSDFSKHTVTSEEITFSISPNLKSDCVGTCDGKARIDECGVCSEGESYHKYNSDLDCTDTCFGGASIDDCGVCSGGKTGIAPNADKDCENMCFGDAYLDDCNVCSEGNTGHIANSDIDCSGECFGGAIIDDCDIWSGGKTGIALNADKDCENLCFGCAYLDDCYVCSEGNTGHIPNKDMDCNGDCFGRAKIDDCEICAGGKTGIKPNKDIDCAGDCFGEAIINECNYCIGGSTGFKDSNALEGDFFGAYGQDCNQVCNGKAVIDLCQMCTKGNTEYKFNQSLDCNGDCNSNSPLWDGDLGGTSYLDDCGVCSEGNSNHIADSDKDCNGDCFGKAIIDPCGGCTGGESGVELNQSPVKHRGKEYTCGDLMFVLEMYRLKYPNHECSTKGIIGNENKLMTCIDNYLSLGESRWNGEGRLTQYTLSDENIDGIFPLNAQYATKLYYLDISKNEFWGPFPTNFCGIHEKGTLRIGGNRFCPPYPDCLNNSPILLIDIEDMMEVSRCNP